MSPIFPAILLGQLLLISGALASFSQSGLKCTGVSTIELSEWETKCMAEVIPKELAKLELLEICTCSLLRHNLIWQSMLTHDIDTLFFATKDYVEETAKEEEEKERNEGEKEGNKDDSLILRRDHVIFTANPDGELRFFWDKLNAIIRDSLSEEEAERVGQFMIKKFSKIAYNPTTFKKSYRQTITAGRAVSNACNDLWGKFNNEEHKFRDWFHFMKIWAENPRFTFEVAASDEALFKVLTVFNVCKLLATGGYIYN